MKTNPHKTTGLARPCSAHDLFTVAEGLQCGNCLVLVTDNRPSTTVSNQFITPENTLAEIKKHAESAGVVLTEAPANIVKDREGPVRAEHIGYYQVVAELPYQLASFLTALRQRSHVAAEVSGIRPWLKVLEFEMPAARVTVTHVVLGQANNQPPPVAALLSFVPAAVKPKALTEDEMVALLRDAAEKSDATLWPIEGQTTERGGQLFGLKHGYRFREALAATCRGESERILVPSNASDRKFYFRDWVVTLVGDPNGGFLRVDPAKITGES